MSSSAPGRVHAILIVVQVCFATGAIAGRMALESLPAWAVFVVRIVFAASCFFLLARRLGPVRVARADLGRVILCALTGVVFNQALFMNGLARSTATNASVMGVSIPVFATLFSVLAGRERTTPAKLLSIAIALGGALLLVEVDEFSFSDTHAVGNLLLLANCLSYAAFLVLVQPLARSYAPLTVVAVIFGTASLVAIPVGAVVWPPLVPGLTPGLVGTLAFIVAVPTVAAYSLNQLAMRHAEPSLVALYIYLQPVVTALMAYPILGERPTLRTTAAAVLIFTGVYLGAARVARVTGAG